MSNPLSTQTNPNLNSNGNLEKPINSNNTDNLEDVHLTMAIPKSEEFATLWRTSELHVKNKDTSAAIGPLGLLGFGLTTFLLNLGNAGVFDMAPLSCLAQLIAGIMEWKKGNNFTSVAFISFATFWWSFVSIHAIPSLGWLNAEGYESSLHTSMGWYLILWFVFTFIMFIASFTKPWAIQVVFGTLCLLFILLAAHNFAENENTLKAAGVIGMICAFSAIYSGAAEIINGAWLITILPLGGPGEKWLGKISAE